MTSTAISRFEIGDRAETEVDITEEFVRQFAEFSGDHNPLHVDSAFAATTSFHRRVAHGMSFGAIFSRLIGMELPGPGALWASQSFQFSRPVFVGDRLRISVEVSGKSESTNLLILQCLAVNQTGESVLAGEGQVLVLEREQVEPKTDVERNRVALITGGTRGIGAAIAKQLSQDGFSVAVTYKSSVEQAKSFCSGVNGCISIQSDAADPRSAAHVHRSVAQTFGPPDTLILNAGGRELYGHSADGDFTLFSGHLSTQLSGAHALVSACMDHMIDRGFGVILGVSSAFAHGVPPSGMAPYVVGKAALEAYIRCLAVDYGPKGIRANAVAPGMTNTSLLAGVPERQRKVAAAQNPSRRLATVEDVAAAAAFLVSDGASYVNGHTMLVTGGSTAS